MLEMEDEAGIDHKLVCVPAKQKIDPICGAWQSLDDVPEMKKPNSTFFEHYKDLEEGKWVKLKTGKTRPPPLNYSLPVQSRVEQYT